MKKLTALFLVILLAVGCAACDTAESGQASLQEGPQTEGSAAVSETASDPAPEAGETEDAGAAQPQEPITSGWLCARERDVTNGISTWHTYDLFGRKLFDLREGEYGYSTADSSITELCEYQDGRRIVYTFLYGSAGDIDVGQRTYDERDRLISQTQYTGMLQTDGYSFEPDRGNSFTYTYSDDGLEMYPDHGENVYRLDESGKIVYSETHVGNTKYVIEQAYDDFGNICKYSQKVEMSGEIQSDTTYTYENEYENGLLTKTTVTAEDGTSSEGKSEYYNVEDGYEDVYTGMWTEEGGDGFLMISLINGLYCMGYREEAGFLFLSGYGEYYNRDGETAELSCDYVIGRDGLEEYDGENIPLELQGDRLIVDGVTYVKQE